MQQNVFFNFIGITWASENILEDRSIQKYHLGPIRVVSVRTNRDLDQDARQKGGKEWLDY